MLGLRNRRDRIGAVVYSSGYQFGGPTIPHERFIELKGLVLLSALKRMFFHFVEQYLPFFYYVWGDLLKVELLEH